MSVVRFEGSEFYWTHHPATPTNVDHYTLHGASGKPVTLPTGFYCMVKRLGDKRWWWRIAHLHGFTPEQKGTCDNRTRAMTEAETATRKILADAAVPGVATISKGSEKKSEKHQGEKIKSNGVG